MISGPGSPIVSTPFALVFGGLLLRTVSDALSVVVAITALFAAATRYTATLGGASERNVKNATAVGFFLGLVVSAVIVIVDALW